MNPTTLLSGLGAAVTADPATGSASSAGRDAGSGSGDLFLALVAGLLQGDTQGSQGTQGAEGPAVPAAPAESSGDGTEAALPVLPPVPEPAPATPEEPAPTTDEPVAAGIDAAALQRALGMPPIVAQAAASNAATASLDGTTAPATSVAAAPTTGNTAGQVAAAGGSGQASADPGRSGDPAPQAATTPAAPTSIDTAGPQAGAAATQRSDVRVDPLPAQAPVTSVPGAATVAPTTAAAGAPTASADVHRVTGQVFPEVLRASADAETGTSRVTVRLNPESLGEVRIVLTQRRGGLEVSLAAGTDAQLALSDGAPELRRLLESVGRADSRILIRDLPTGQLPPAAPPNAPTSAPAVRTDVSTDLAGGAWSGAGRPGGEPAPDREHSRHRPGSSNATDGISSAIPASRPTTTTSPGRAGLDLSM